MSKLLRHSCLDLKRKLLAFFPCIADFKVKDVQGYPDGHIDVCLFNGAIRNSENEAMAQLLRRKSKILVAFGSCAYEGCIPALSNLTTRDATLRAVFLDNPSVDNPDGVLPQPVTVVPMFAPKIMPTDCCKVMSPALTKLTSMTVVALDDCMMEVMIKPVKTPAMRRLVTVESIDFIRSPAAICSDSLMIFIPKRKRPSPPKMVMLTLNPLIDSAPFLVWDGWLARAAGRQQAPGKLTFP